MSTEPKHIDNAALAELKIIMEDDFKLLVDTFLADSKMRVITLKSSLDAKDAKLFAETAHSLKGSSLNVSAPHLSDLCQMLETMGRSGDLSSASATLVEVESEFECVSSLLLEFSQS